MNFDRVGKSEKISYLLEKVCNLEIALKNEAKERKYLENCLKDERGKVENLQKLFTEELHKCLNVHQRNQAEIVGLKRWLEGKLGPVCEEEEDVKFVPPGSLLADASVENGRPIIVSNPETSSATNDEEGDVVDHERSVRYMEMEANQQSSAEESAAESDDSSSFDFKMSSISSSFRQMEVENEEHETTVAAVTSSSSSGYSPDKKRLRRSEESENSVVKVKMPFFNCKMCSKRFSLRPKLISHMKRRHGVIASKKKRKQVSQTTSGQHFPCTHCTKEFASKSGLHSHTIVHTPARKKSYRCPADKCGNKYYTVENFEKHIETRHGNEALEFSCLECENNPTFGSDGGLYADHVQAEHDGKPRRQK